MRRSTQLNCLLLGTVLCLAGLVACDAFRSPVAPRESSASEADSAQLSTAAKPTQEPQLNLSHIECVDDGTVEIHFVLLFVPEGVIPGTLTYTYGTIEPGANTGNVWHYTDHQPPGFYDVTSASVEVDGVTVFLHNPGEYAGTYNCGEDVCEGLPDPEPLLCLPVLGNPSAECGYFGLVAQDKDDGLTGTTHVASQDAALALVKDGNGPCGQGEIAYRTYTDVHAGDVLEQPEGAGDISHVTYCACPPPSL
jgi:hypothetical protein